MIHAPYYKKLSSYIFENNDLDIQFLNKYYNELNIKIGNVVKEVLSLKRKLREGEIIIKEPIGKIFKKSEILERNLVAIYFICKKFPPFHFQDYFLRTDLASTLGKNREQYFRKSGRSSGKRNVLLKLKYIINTGYRIERSPLFKLTNIGILKAQRIIKFKSMIYGKRFKSLVLGWKKNFDKIRSNITSKVFKILLHSAYNISELAQLTELKKSQIYSCVGDLKRKGMISCIGKRKDSKLWSAVL